MLAVCKERLLNTGDAHGLHALCPSDGIQKSPLSLGDRNWESLGGPFAFNDRFPFDEGTSTSLTSVFDLSRIKIIEEVPSRGDSMLFRKIETAEDYEEIEAEAFGFTGYSEEPFFELSTSNSVSWLIASFNLTTTNEFVGGLKNLTMDDLARTQYFEKHQDLLPESLLERYGFHAYDRITYGQTAYCFVHLGVRGHEKEKILQRAFENVDGSLFYDKKMNDEYNRILRGLPFSPSYECSCGAQGFDHDKILHCRRLDFHEFRDAFWQMGEGTPTPLSGVTSKISASVELLEEMKKLPEEVINAFTNDDAVTFELGAENALVLQRDYALANYVSRKANGYDFAASDECNDVVQGFWREVKMYRQQRARYNATDLKMLSERIQAGEFVGQGREILDRFNALKNSCSSPPTIAPPTPAPPTIAPSTPAAPPGTSGAAANCATGVAMMPFFAVSLVLLRSFKLV